MSSSSWDFTESVKPNSSKASLPSPSPIMGRKWVWPLTSQLLCTIPSYQNDLHIWVCRCLVFYFFATKWNQPGSFWVPFYPTKMSFVRLLLLVLTCSVIWAKFDPSARGALLDSWERLYRKSLPRLRAVDVGGGGGRPHFTGHLSYICSNILPPPNKRELGKNLSF